jgi:hypothetical protein
VLHVHYELGEKPVMHYNPRSVAVFLTDGNPRMTLPAGKSTGNAGKADTGSWAAAEAIFRRMSVPRLWT